MKKILIVNRSYDIGGIETAMVNMANALCSLYEVHIISFNPDGILKSRLDDRVKILLPCKNIQLLATPLSTVLKNGNIAEKILRSMYAASSRIFDNRLCIKHAFRKQEKLIGYDLAISFCHEQPKHSVTSGFCRFIDQCTDAKMKAAWIHYDASSVDLSHSFNERYYRRMDKIVAVSESVQNAFGNAFPSLMSKLDFCYNFFDSEDICAKSQQKQTVLYPQKGLICFSACRLSKEKGIERAIAAFSKTLIKYQDVYWFIAGDGDKKEEILSLIKKYGLEKQIMLIGYQENPYPYIKNCDLYLSVSYHEAAPMVYLEAKILHTPVFSTKTLSTAEMLKDHIEDFVCENDEKSMEILFYKLVENRTLIFKAHKALQDYKHDNSGSSGKIKEWIM